MEEAVPNSDGGSVYQLLPIVPEQLVGREFLLKDVNVEITSMDIAPHGSYLVAGSSSGMILLFDLSNPSAQTDGLLIGQIRARGMHTNLIVTVKFSEDGRFVFAGVSKGSSEMLAIDLGKVLVDWNSNNVSVINRNSSDELQQLQLSSMVTFTFSDAKLRGFGAVVRMDTPYSERAMTGSSGGGAFRDSSALYRLACGRGIKNVHIWHFRVGYLEQHKPSVDCDLDCMQQQLQQLHGKWEYVCDVASNGNTITHIEFRQGGNELLSKSAGMCIRLWDLQSSSKLFDEATTTTTSTGAAAIDGAATTTTPEGESNDSSMPAAPAPAPESALPTAAPTSTAGYVLLKPSYVDIANSQDVKCMLPVGTGAYGGTYQFAVLNTAAPREANRDVLELPERFSGDASVASSVAIGNPLTSSGGASSSAFMSAGAGRGRRITREIEQVICTDEGRHALILCADGGVVYYCAPFTTAAAATGPSVSLSNNEQQQQYSVGGPSSDAEEEQSAESATDAAASTAEDTCGGGGGGGGTGQLVEMGALFRQKDQQQHPGSWALRRVGRQGIVVLLRASSGSAAGVTVEVRQLSALFAQDSAEGRAAAMAQAQAADSGSSSSNSFCFYQDPSEHEAQKALRRAWVVQQSSTHLTAAAANKGARRPKQHLQQQQLPETPCGVNEVPGSAVAASVPRGVAAAESSSAPRKRKALVSTQDVTDKDKDKDTRSPISSRQQRPAVPSSAKRSYSNGGPGGDGVADGGGSGSGSKFITPAAVQASGSKHNRISPGDYADRLASQCHSHSNGGSSADLLAGYSASGGISNVSPTVSPRPRSSLQASNSYGYGRGSRQAVPGNSSSSFSSASASATVARLRALRDDDEDGEPATATACAEQGQRQEQVQEEQFTAAIVARQSKKFATAEQLLHSQIRRELPAIQVGPAPKVRRIAPALPAAVVGTPNSSSNSNTSRAVSPLHSACMALVHRWVACCSSVTPALASSPWGGALVGVDKQPQLALGVCALERLGAILMEQDRVKALFLREVTSALSSHLEKHLVPPTTPSLPLLRETDVLVSSLVHKHRGVAEEVVRRQQLDLQGACAVDAVVRGGFTSTATLSSGTSGGGSGGGAGCWGDAFKVCFRHSGAFDSALQLQGAIRGMLSTAPVADSAR